MGILFDDDKMPFGNPFPTKKKVKVKDGKEGIGMSEMGIMSLFSKPNPNSDFARAKKNVMLIKDDVKAGVSNAKKKYAEVKAKYQEHKTKQKFKKSGLEIY